MNLTQLKESHDNQNEAYIAEKSNLFENGEAPRDQWLALANKRIEQLLADIQPISPEEVDAMPDYIEVVDCFVSFFDDVTLECAQLTNRRAEVEKAILGLCQGALGKPTEEKTRNSDEEHVACALIDGIIMHELPLVVRAAAVKSAMLHDTNPLRLGYTLYESFCVKYPEHADLQTLEYFRCEELLRNQLLSGNPADSAETAARLMAMPINNPERYLLMSMVVFFNGFIDDAARTLELGLNDFPDNERLLKAQEGLALALA